MPTDLEVLLQGLAVQQAEIIGYLRMLTTGGPEDEAIPVQLEAPAALLALLDQVQAAIRELRERQLPEIIVPPLDLQPVIELMQEVKLILGEIPAALAKGGGAIRVSGGTRGAGDTVRVLDSGGNNVDFAKEATQVTRASETTLVEVRDYLDTVETKLQSLIDRTPDTSGTWGYDSGTSGILTLTGSKKVLLITATAIEAAGSIIINNGDTILLPYGSTDKISSDLSIVPHANLIDPEIEFIGTDSFFVEWVE